jgi:hypothetical protein
MGTSFRLVAPQRVQIHSAVVAAVAMQLHASAGGSELLEGAPDQLRRLRRGTLSQCGPDGVICRDHPISQAHQSPNRLLRFRAPACRRVNDYVAETVLQLQHQPFGLFPSDAAD